MAPILMRTNRGSWAVLFLLLAILGFAWLMRNRMGSYTPWEWTFWILLWIDAPARLLFPTNTQERSRSYFVWSIARFGILEAIAFWDGGQSGAIVSLVTLFYVYIDYQRWTIFRKLAGAPAPSTLAVLVDPMLTRGETLVLQTLRRGGEPGLLFFAVLVVATYWLPATAGPLTAAMAFGFLLPRFLPVYTPVRSRKFRWAKWTALAIASILPVFLHALVPWTGAAFVALTFWIFEAKRISLRRKLPVEDWPKELYL